ncbi:MAG: hypothetical protein PHR28_00885 [candidate division Zixibacteria bacterium]|nr:hypothetical protein [candidate division Zixibacteria bacterium]
MKPVIGGNSCDTKRIRYGMMLRVYCLHELLAMFRGVGFFDPEWYGSIKE